MRVELSDGNPFGSQVIQMDQDIRQDSDGR